MNTTTHNKPLGFWLAVVVEHRTHDAMRSAFADQGVSRREWRLLNVIENRPTTIEQIKAAKQASASGTCHEAGYLPAPFDRGCHRRADPARLGRLG